MAKEIEFGSISTATLNIEAVLGKAKEKEENKSDEQKRTKKAISIAGTALPMLRNKY